MFSTNQIMIMASGIVLIFSTLLFAAANPQDAPGTEDGEKEKSWSAHIELSYVNTSGNTDTESLAALLNLNASTNSDSFYFSSGVLFAQQDGVESSNRLTLEGRWERTISEKIFGFVETGYERDKFSGYDYRSSAGAGLGYDWLRSTKQELKNFVSLTYNHDSIAHVDIPNNNYGSLKLSVEYYRQITENLRFRESSDGTISLEDSNNYFLNSLTALEVKAYGNISIGLSYLVNYRNLIFAPGIKQTDKTFMTSVIIDF